METIGQIIGKSNREEHYEYYLSLGYEQKAAAHPIDRPDTRRRGPE